MRVKLPYFDMIFSRLAAGDREFEEIFYRHVHYGAWENPEEATGTRADSVESMDRLCYHMIDLAQVEPGMDLLDAGCGFGGTLACLNERFDRLRMTGLNIDPRQLELARKRVTARAENRLEFVHGDACAMPFPDQSFDRVLAVECIFHFPSRGDFFEHVGRVLRPGGSLTISDFVTPEGTPKGNWDEPDHAIWGQATAIDIREYQELAARAGLRLVHFQDISMNVRPTYQWFGALLGKHFPEAGKAIAEAQFVLDIGGVGYCTLKFER